MKNLPFPNYLFHTHAGEENLPWGFVINLPTRKEISKHLKNQEKKDRKNTINHLIFLGNYPSKN
jgi:hypothetical protein